MPSSQKIKKENDKNFFKLLVLNAKKELASYLSLTCSLNITPVARVKELLDKTKAAFLQKTGFEIQIIMKMLLKKPKTLLQIKKLIIFNIPIGIICVF